MQISKNKTPCLSRLNRSKGFSMIELVVVLVIVAGLLFVLWPKIEQVMGMGDSGKLNTQVGEIQQGAMMYKQRQNVYTGISMTVLDAQGFVSDRMGDGTAINPWGGNYTVAADGSDPTKYIITATGIQDAKAGARIAADYAVSADSATFSGTTLTLKFQG